MLAIFLLFTTISYGQDSRFDSLAHYYPLAIENPEYIHKLYQFSFRVHRVSPDTSIKYANIASELALEYNDSAEYAFANYCLGVAYSVKGEYEKALDYTIKAYKLRDKTGRKDFGPSVLTSLGILYEYINDFEKAIETHQQAVDQYRDINDQEGTATALNNLAIVHVTYNNNFNQALKCFNESLEIRKKLNIKDKIASSFNNIGETYMYMDNYSKAIEYINKATVLYKELNDIYGLAINYKNIGQLYYKQNDLKNAMKYINKSIEYASDLDLKLVLQENYELLSEIYRDQDNYKLAYEYYLKYSGFKDNILNENNTKQISELKTKFETEKAQHELIVERQEKELKETELQKQKFIRNAIIIITILALIILLMIFNRAINQLMNKNKQEII